MTTKTKNRLNSEIEVKSKQAQVAEHTPEDILNMAVAGDITGDQIDRMTNLMELKEKWEQTEAKKAYYKAMTAFKADPPKIVKDKQVAFSSTKYKHATLANVCEQIGASLSKHGLSHSWETVQDDKGRVGVVTKITHELTHSEQTVIWAPADDSGHKNKIQQIGSTITYLQRYGLLAMTGLATEDQDDDGQTSKPVQLIGEKQISTLRDHLNIKDFEESRLLKWAKIEKIEDLPMSKYADAIRAIKEAKK